MSDITYEVDRIPDTDRITSLRGQYRVIARCGESADFAIAATEDQARAKATQRLHYRMSGFA